MAPLPAPRVPRTRTGGGRGLNRVRGGCECACAVRCGRGRGRANARQPLPLGADAGRNSRPVLCSDGLFAAAGVKMASTTPKARQSMLAEVSKPVARQHVNLDSGSSERLVAAAENRWCPVALANPRAPPPQHRARTLRCTSAAAARTRWACLPGWPRLCTPRSLVDIPLPPRSALEGCTHSIARSTSATATRKCSNSSTRLAPRSLSTLRLSTTTFECLCA